MWIWETEKSHVVIELVLGSAPNLLCCLKEIYGPFFKKIETVDSATDLAMQKNYLMIYTHVYMAEGK